MLLRKQSDLGLLFFAFMLICLNIQGLENTVNGIEIYYYQIHIAIRAVTCVVILLQLHICTMVVIGLLFWQCQD